MIKLRLKRLGKKREASYRIVAMESSTRRDGRPLQELGFYNPRSGETRLDSQELLKWLNNGAQPTDTVRDILRRAELVGPKPGTPAGTPAATPAASTEAATTEAAPTEASSSEAEATEAETSEASA
ncbi:30S ribosomal protein S16 [Geitlerinema sp. P-1104]|uniref:30S ribosomal protein S16 n=1 Tax=Geitlerinema sp. P-1104 TaxID=2546230 RepID=UPI00147727E1|nr:30S ribosomal protein S16 [Geitlerinema sp. P-1104]